MKIVEIILVLAFPNIWVLHIATQFEADALDALFNLGKPQTNWKQNLEILTQSIRLIHTWVSSIGSQQHRNVCNSSFLRNRKVYPAWHTDGIFCRWISHISADRDQWGLWIMSLSRFWWGVPAKKREGPSCSSDLGVICSLLHLQCLFFPTISSVSIIPLIYHWTFHSIPAVLFELSFISQHILCLSQFLPLVPGQSGFLHYIEFVYLF